MKMLAVSSVLLFLNPTFAVEKTKITLTGSSTVAPLVSELAQDFMKSHTSIKIEVQTGGSTKGIVDCREKLNDLGMISRSLNKEEQDLIMIPIAQDGLALAVNKQNKVHQLTRSQVIDIFTGKISNWKLLGGDDAKIVIINKGDGRATLELFLQYFNINKNEIKADIIIGDEEQGVKTISSQKYSIGYIGVSSLEMAIMNEVPIQAVKLDNIMPTSENIKTAKYPLSRYLSIIQCKQANASMTEFIKYLKSTDGQTQVKKLNYIPILN